MRCLRKSFENVAAVAVMFVVNLFH